MKNVITTLVLFLFFSLFGQENLKDIDTTFDYLDRFYSNGKLITTNSFIYIDSNNSYTINEIYLNPNIDTSQLKRVEHGLWKEYFDKKWRICDSSNFNYYRLGEYDFGDVIGKVYYFSKNGKITHTALRYPKSNDSIFNGVRKISYHKGKITFIEYQRFDDYLSKGLLYINLTHYFPDGQIKTFVLSDDYNHQSHSIEYKKNGFCVYELKLNQNESYLIKRKLKGRKEIIETKENGKPIKIIKINGLEKRRNKGTR